MFGMLHGGWPRIKRDGVDLASLEADVAAGRAVEQALVDARDRLAAEVVAAQVEAGLDLVTDGQVRFADLGGFGFGAVSAIASQGAPSSFFADIWRTTAALTDRPVAQAIPGPFTMGRRAKEGPPAVRGAITLAFAEALGTELRTLADVGCPMVVVEEPDATQVGGQEMERRLFVDTQQRLLETVPDLHAMLAISGGSAALAGPETIFAAPYRSHLFDLIAGPDDWALVRAAPSERGIVCAALRAGPGAVDDQAPLLVWAAAYAASTGRRGLERVGLANATPLRDRSWDEAVAVVTALGRAAKLAGMTPEEAIAAGLDPRTFGNRRTRPPVPRRRSKGTR